MSHLLNVVKAGVSRLDPSEATAAAKWARAFSGHQITPDDLFAEHAYSEISSCFCTIHSSSHPPSFFTWSAAAKRRQREAFLDGVDHTRERIGDWWPTAPRNVRLGLMRFLCRLAFDDCRRHRVRVTWEDVSANLLRIGEVVSSTFPGWLENGLFQQRAMRRITGKHG